MMKRTQIYIKEETHNKVKSLAKKQKRSISDIFREFVEEGLNNKEKKKSLSKLANLSVSGGPKDLSENMDEYIYGNKK